MGVGVSWLVSKRLELGLSKLECLLLMSKSAMQQKHKHMHKCPKNN